MGYPSFLCHFNPNHDPKNGQFTDGPKMGYKQQQKENKKLYKQTQKAYGTPGQIEREMSKNAALRDAARDEKLQQAYKKLKATKVNQNLKEPEWYEDKATMDYAVKKFKKDWPDWDKDPTDHKMFDYYLEEGSQKSKTWAAKVEKYEKAKKADNWHKVYAEYEKELERVAKAFAGSLADKPFNGNKYYPYSSAVRFALDNVLFD